MCSCNCKIFDTCLKEAHRKKFKSSDESLPIYVHPNHKELQGFFHRYFCRFLCLCVKNKLKKVMKQGSIEPGSAKPGNTDGRKKCREHGAKSNNPSLNFLFHFSLFYYSLRVYSLCFIFLIHLLFFYFIFHFL